MGPYQHIIKQETQVTPSFHSNSYCGSPLHDTQRVVPGDQQNHKYSSHYRLIETLKYASLDPFFSWRGLGGLG